MSSGRDAMRFTTLVPALEEQLAAGVRTDGLVGLGTVEELTANLARILHVAETAQQQDRVERIRALQQRLASIEAQAVLQLGADARDPSMEMVVSMRAPPAAEKSPSRATVAGALALTICTAGLAAPWYISLRKKHKSTSSPAIVRPTMPTTPAAPTITPASLPVPEAVDTSLTTTTTTTTIECPICFSEETESYGLLECTHRYCQPCFVMYFSTRINNGEVGAEQLVCPSPGCNVAAQAYELEAVLPDDVFVKYTDLITLRGLDADQQACWCPNTACGEAIVVPADHTEVNCPACRQSFCKLCRLSPWHAGQTCEQAKTAADASKPVEEDGLLIWMRDLGDKVKQCPGCKEAIEKNDGCNHMTCARCKQQFCWLCGNAYESGHFNSGPCDGLQFAAGNSLEEALRLRGPQELPDILQPPIMCGMRMPDFDLNILEPDFDLHIADRPPSPPPACGLRMPDFDLHIADRPPSPPMPPQPPCGMRMPMPPPPPPPPPACGLRMPMLPPILQPTRPTPPPTACGMRLPPAPPTSPPILPPTPPPTIPQPPRPTNTRPACGMRMPTIPRPNMPVPIRRCGKRAPDKQVMCGKRAPDKPVPAVSKISKLLVQRRCSQLPPKAEPTVALALPTAWSHEAKERMFNTCKMMLDMLETIEDSYSALFHSRDFLLAAWRRFVSWIQLLHTNRSRSAALLPPLDVAFIWHAYMIRTEIYLADLPAILDGEQPGDLGMQVAWKCGGSLSSDEDVETSRRLWNDAYPLSPYDSWSSAPPSASPVGSSSSSSSSDGVDLPLQLRMSFLLEDLNWLPDLRRGWPRFTADRCDFLNDTLDRYIDWLETTYTQPTTSLKGPPIDIDAFWHSHMLSPALYQRDIEQHYGVGRTIWHRPLADGVHDPATL